MKCLRCGYCCIHYDVIIVDIPEIGIVEGNLKHKKSGVPCQHLQKTNNQFECKIHDAPWYEETPCYQHTQVEKDSNSLCRIGISNQRNLP